MEKILGLLTMLEKRSVTKLEITLTNPIRCTSYSTLKHHLLLLVVILRTRTATLSSGLVALRYCFFLEKDCLFYQVVKKLFLPSSANGPDNGITLGS